MTLTCLGGAVNVAVRWPDVMTACNEGELSRVALTSTLAAVIRSGPARPETMT